MHLSLHIAFIVAYYQEQDRIFLAQKQAAGTLVREINQYLILVPFKGGQHGAGSQASVAAPVVASQPKVTAPPAAIEADLD